MDDIEAQAVVATLETQRNLALTHVLQLAGKLALSEARVRELETKIKSTEGGIA